MTTSNAPDPTTITRPATNGPETQDLDAAERSIKGAAIITAGFGLFLAISSTDATDGLLRYCADLVFFRRGEGPDHLTDTNHLVDAIAGGVMVGWGVMFWLLADRLLHTAPKQIKHIMITSLACWFMVDSAGSIASGGWLNAVLNLSFPIMFGFALRTV